jgi:SWI/SNF-related matrix-associated actin-dependent regulator of chromatin subfamily A-like protein 1
LHALIVQNTYIHKMHLKLSFGIRAEKIVFFVQPVSSGIIGLMSLCKEEGFILDKMNLSGVDEELCIYQNKYDQLVDILHRHKHTFEVIPDRLVRAFERKPTEQIELGLLGNTSTYNKLNQHQQSFVRWFISNGCKGINASEMGTGKTATGVCILEYLAQPTVVICPSSLRQNWKDEIKKFSNIDSNIIQKGTSDLEGTINIISYSLLASSAFNIKKLIGTKVLILDESHYLKSQRSLRTKAVLSLSRNIPSILLLSGTPLSKPSELYTQLKLIDNNVFRYFFPYGQYSTKNEFYFASRYCQPTKVFLGKGRTGYTFNGSELEHELHALLTVYTVRITKKESLPNLPVKTRERHFLEPVDDRYKEMFNTELKDLEKIRETYGANRADRDLMRLVRKTSELKHIGICTYIDGILNGPKNHKYLLFGHHKAILDTIEDRVKTSGVGYIRIDGSVPSVKRQVLVNSFQTDPNVRFAVLSIQAAGVGLNMFAADRVVFCELIWSDNDHVQSEDRAHRQNQTRPVHVTYLILPGTTDELVWRCICKKKAVSKVVLDNERTISKRQKT